MKFEEIEIKKEDIIDQSIIEKGILVNVQDDSVEDLVYDIFESMLHNSVHKGLYEIYCDDEKTIHISFNPINISILLDYTGKCSIVVYHTFANTNVAPVTIEGNIYNGSLKDYYQWIVKSVIHKSDESKLYLVLKQDLNKLAMVLNDQ